jgi:hypothetical protein
MADDSDNFSDLSDEERIIEDLNEMTHSALSLDEIPYSRDLDQVNKAMPERIKVFQNQVKAYQMRSVNKPNESYDGHLNFNTGNTSKSSGKPERTRTRGKNKPKVSRDSKEFQAGSVAQNDYFGNSSALRPDATPYVPLRASAQPFVPSSQQYSWVTY